MVACPKCTLNNTLDSLFCRKCGATLPTNMIEEEQEKLKELVAKGMISFEAGKTEEAMMIADHAVMANPTYSEAFALKGMVHERKGEYAEALDSYETVVSLNPNSTIDKIKLNQLRNAFAQRKAGTATPDRKTAALMALAATLLVGSVGFATVRLVNGSASKTVQNEAPKTNVQQPINQAQPKLNTPTVQNPQVTQATNQPATSSNDEVQPIRQNQEAPTRTRSQSERTASNSNGGRRGGMSGTLPYDLGPAPVVTPTGVIGTVGKTLPNQNGGGGGNVPGPNDGNNNRGNDRGFDPKPQPNGPTNPAKGDDKGHIEVSISTGPSKPRGNQEADVLQKTGNERMRSGDAEGAIKAYEGASRAGSSSGKVHQRQAQAHARQGRKSEAQASYQRAISAYEQDIKSGKGNKDTNEAALASCRAALRQLG